MSTDPCFEHRIVLSDETQTVLMSDGKMRDRKSYVCTVCGDKGWAYVADEDMEHTYEQGDDGIFIKTPKPGGTIQ